MNSLLITKIMYGLAMEGVVQKPSKAFKLTEVAGKNSNLRVGVDDERIEHLIHTLCEELNVSTPCPMSQYENEKDGQKALKETSARLKNIFKLAQIYM